MRRSRWLWQEEDAAAEVVRLAAGVAGASAAVLWESREDGLVSAASWGVDVAAGLAAARELAERALAEPGPVSAHAAGLPQDCAVSTTLPLGRPPLGVLQLFHPAGEEPEAEQLTRLATFGVRAAHALRTGERARLLAFELERTRALLEVIVQATAELSVSHTLETAVERVAELLEVDRVAVYLRGTGEASSRRRRVAASPARTRASPTGCSTSRSAPRASERCSRSRTSCETHGSRRSRRPPGRPGSARLSPFR